MREALERLARWAGYDLVPRSYYSPMPDREALSSGVFDQRRPMPGIAWDLDAQVTWLREELIPHAGDLPDFDPENGSFGTGDAEVLHAMVRASRPRRVVELGSGASTRIIRAALGGEGRHEVFDPHPRLWDGVQPVRAQDLPDAVFTALDAGDLLFVDTTHTVKTGGDVDRIILGALPLLAPGVVVHFHDVHLPWDYPPGLVLDERRAWAEQYLLQAFLADNPHWEVLLGLAALARERPATLRELVPSWRPHHFPSSFYIRRR